MLSLSIFANEKRSKGSAQNTTMSFKAAFELSVRTLAWVHVHASVAVGLQARSLHEADSFPLFKIQ